MMVHCMPVFYSNLTEPLPSTTPQTFPLHPLIPRTHLLCWHRWLLLHPVHATTPTHTLSSWAWHWLARSSSHGSPLVWHKAKSPAVHRSALPGPKVGYSGEVGSLTLRHAGHKVRWVHLHLILHTQPTQYRTGSASHQIPQLVSTSIPEACDWTSSACVERPSGPAAPPCAEPELHREV